VLLLKLQDDNRQTLWIDGDRVRDHVGTFFILVPIG